MNVIMLLKPKDTVKYIYDNYTLRQGLEKMRAHGYTAIPVINADGEYVGTVNEGDFLYNIIVHKIYKLQKLVIFNKVRTFMRFIKTQTRIPLLS